MIAKTRRAMPDIRRKSAICGFTNARALTVRRLVNTESACDGGKCSQLAGATSGPLRPPDDWLGRRSRWRAQVAARQDRAGKICIAHESGAGLARRPFSWTSFETGESGIGNVASVQWASYFECSGGS